MATLDDISSNNTARFYVHMMSIIASLEKRQLYDLAASLCLIQAQYFKYLSELPNLEQEKARELREKGKNFLEKSIVYDNRI